jgi:hypothetical protein
MLLYSLTIFLSAFLLFQVQPIVAKMILPWFGGSSAVWSTCMLFFQVVLLLGYLYAHWLHEKLAPRRQAVAHIAALAVSFAALPILPHPGWKSVGAAHPSLTILALLSVTVGLPYFLLSSTSPLLQAWYARTHREGMPYRLFALSNFASMLALLSYPFVVEPNLPARVQGLVWSAAYILFAALCGTAAWRSCARAAAPQAAAREGAPTANGRPAWTLRLLWLGLAASASVLLLAVTNHLTQDVAAIPFLWILPLSVYLLSFIVCFESPRFYQRAIFLPLLGVALAFMAYRLWPYRTEFNPTWLGWLTRMPIRWVVVSFAAGLFACCMVCHGELARLKPHPRYLTGFYVTVSLGGAVGGLFVGLVAPNLFRAYYEFPIGLGLCAAVAFLVLARGLWRLAGGALWARPRWGAAALALVLREMVDGYRVVARNFYGLLRVQDQGNPRMDENACRTLIHGTINHGAQFLRAPYRRQPVTYFCPQSGIGLALQAQDGPPRRIGILGLGCGTLAAYGRPGDTLRIYEINPLVLDIARREFTYLRDTPARVEIALGDGRLVLESEPSQQFDVLVMDAFSGDSVPVHLITLEAFRTYFRHLKPGGILAVNITNSYLDLRPVMERAAAAFGKVALVYDFTPESNDFLCFSCSWTLIMDRATLAARPDLQLAGEVLRQKRAFRAWTDDFSNMFSILR